MKKKLIVGILVLTMLVVCLSVGASAAGDGTVTGTIDAATFFGSADENGTIKLTGDVTFSGGAWSSALDKDYTIDLNGHKLTADCETDGGKSFLWADGGHTLTIKGTGTITGSAKKPALVADGNNSKLVIADGSSVTVTQVDSAEESVIMAQCCSGTQWGYHYIHQYKH